MARWEIRQLDMLITDRLSNDATIKTKMHVTSGKARVSLYRVVKDPNWYPYIYGYCIPGPDAPGQGTSRIQSNPHYDLEVRTVKAPTQESEDIIDRIDEIICSFTHELTPDGLWVVAARRVKPIVLTEPGETEDTYYTRRGGTYMFQVVRS